jgi:quercetin dioxygenase-like cupin family protein
MKINHGREAGLPSDKRGPTFTGTVWAEPLLTGAPGVSVNTVFFPPGARTHWHTHATGQILLVSHGRGYVINESGEGGPILSGDVVWIDAGERHWHGAGPDSYLTHTAISLGDADWQDAVTDEQYHAAWRDERRAAPPA